MISIVLPFLIFIFMAMLLANTVVFYILYRQRPDSLKKATIYFWVSHLTNVIVAALFINVSHPSLMALELLAWPMMFWSSYQLMKEFEPGMTPVKSWQGIIGAGFGLSLILGFLSSDFVLITMPAIIALGLTGLIHCWKFYQLKRITTFNPLEKFFLISLVFFMFHMMDWPFVKTNPEFASWGCTLYVLNIMGLAILLPAMTIGQNAEFKEKELEAIITERTDKMFQQSKLSALGQMAAGIAHEINSPLGLIFARTQLLMKQLNRGDRPEVLLEGLAQVEKTTILITQIVKGLKNFSRLEDTQELRPVRMRDIIDDILLIGKEKYHYKNIELYIDDDGKDILVNSKGPQISQVILNLLNNAFDAVENSPDKWVRIKIQQNAEKVIIVMTDSGPEIPPEVKSKIMQPFFTTKPPEKGTGLGLSISKGIIDAHGGILYLDSEKRETTFVVELPIVITG